MCLSFFSLFGCQITGYRFLRDETGNLIIPKESYKLYKQLSSCKPIEGKFLEVERNRYKNETELNDMIIFYKDGKIKEYSANENGVPKFNRFSEGMYCVDGNKILIEFFYPTHSTSKTYTSIIHGGVINNNEIILKRFNDIITLKKME